MKPHFFLPMKTSRRWWGIALPFLPSIADKVMLAR